MYYKLVEFLNSKEKNYKDGVELYNNYKKAYSNFFNIDPKTNPVVFNLLIDELKQIKYELDNINKEEDEKKNLINVSNNQNPKLLSEPETKELPKVEETEKELDNGQNNEQKISEPKSKKK